MNIKSEMKIQTVLRSSRNKILYKRKVWCLSKERKSKSTV